MTSVSGVAADILARRGPMTIWKPRKLVYYSQAWSLVWDGDALFPEEHARCEQGSPAHARMDPRTRSR